MTAKPKLFRDPVHDIISFDLADPVEKTLYDLVCTPGVQRLRRIRQLGMSFLVYHGAEHSRFTHSMGVCHLALRIFDHLFPKGSAYDRVTVGAAALLHDVGHGPFSHVIEAVSRVRHEEVSQAVLRDSSTEIHHKLAEWDSDLPERVARILSGNGDNPVLSDIVSSQLDADRLDYILRDGHATGVKIGNYDLARILGMMRVHETGVVLSSRAIEAVEGYLLARFHMYKQVYLHKASRSAERMLQACLLRVRALLQAGEKVPGLVPDTPLQKLISGADISVSEHLALDDIDLWAAFKAWSHSMDPILAELSAGLVHRRLYKVIELDPSDPRGPGGAIADAQDALVGAGGNLEYQLLVDNSRDTPYRPYQAGLRAKPIRFQDRTGNVRPIESHSAIVRLLGEHGHDITRLFVPARYQEAVANVAGPYTAPALL